MKPKKRFFQPIVWDDELLELVRLYGNEDVLESERKIFEARQSSYTSQTRLLDTQIKQIKEQILGAQEEINAEKPSFPRLRKNFAAKRALLAKRFLEKPRSLNLNGSSQPTRERTADSGRLSRLPSRKSRFAVAEGRLDHQHYRAGRKRNKRPGWQNRADKGTAPAIARYKTRLEILAPVDGRIVGLQVHSPGGVIQPGQALMDIIAGRLSIGGGGPHPR